MGSRRRPDVPASVVILVWQHWRKEVRRGMPEVKDSNPSLGPSPFWRGMSEVKVKLVIRSKGAAGALTPPSVPPHSG